MKRSALVFASFAGANPTGFCAYSNSGKNQTPLWCQSGSPITFPLGMWVDGVRNLYVADSGGSVFEYDSPSASGPPGAPAFTYNDSLPSLGTQQPNSVVVCGKYLYAANGVSYVQSAPYFSFTVWQIGNATPLGIMTRPQYQNQGCCSAGSGIACDDAGHVIFAYYIGLSGGPTYYGFGGYFDEWTQATPSSLPAYAGTLPAAPRWAQGLAIDRRGELVTGEPFYYYLAPGREGGAVLFFNASNGKQLQSCSKQVSPAMQYPTALAFDGPDRHLWVTDGDETLYQLDPQTCRVTDTIVTGIGGKPFVGLFGVATSPNGIV